MLEVFLFVLALAEARVFKENLEFELKWKVVSQIIKVDYRGFPSISSVVMKSLKALTFKSVLR